MNRDTDTEPMLAVNEVAAILRVSPDTVYRQIAKGASTACRVGNGKGVLRVRRADLKAYITSRTTHHQEGTAMTDSTEDTTEDWTADEGPVCPLTRINRCPEDDDIVRTCPSC